MKAKAFFVVILAALLAANGAAAKEIVRVPAPEGVLPVSITEAVGTIGGAYTDFDRLDLALQAVAKERQWPVKIAAERFAAGTPDYLTELRISLQRVRQEMPGEYVYRAWTTLWIDGKEHKLSVITATYSFRMGENMDDVLNKVFLAGAKATAHKIEPLLFPELPAKKK
jgi:hypothetical protein